MPDRLVVQWMLRFLKSPQIFDKIVTFNKMPNRDVEAVIFNGGVSAKKTLLPLKQKKIAIKAIAK